MLPIDKVYIEGFLPDFEIVLEPADSLICEVHEVGSIEINGNC